MWLLSPALIAHAQLARIKVCGVTFFEIVA